jgi:hypothetical protein
MADGQVTVLSHFPPPVWFDLRARFRQVPFGIELAVIHDDLPYAGALREFAAGRFDTALTGFLVAAIDALGPATHYDEWFDEPSTLIRERLLAPVR